MAERLWLVRHAETAWTLERRHTSSTDVPLTDAGRAEARALAPLLASVGAARVLCSPRARARETARLAGLEPLELCADLVEWDYGDYEGITTAAIREHRPDWSLWRDGCPDGERAEDVAERAERVIAAALDVAGDDVALVAHGHVLRVLAACWVRQPPQLGEHLLLDTASISVLGVDRGVRAIRRWNATP